MLLVLSPAKSLNSERQLPADVTPTLPKDHARAWELIKQLRALSTADIAALMDLSDSLTTLNVGRYEAFKPQADTPTARAALLLFDGDVYDGLNAPMFTPTQWHTAQQTVRVLSGLYGLLRPLDLIQAHRLEMGTRLITPTSKNLYDYWGEHLTCRLNDDLAQGGHTELLNLASTEYFQALKPAKLTVPVIECTFLDEKQGNYKVISFFAKKARGLMARWIVEQNIQHSRDLHQFNAAGYFVSEEDSSQTHWVFKRPEIAATSASV